MYRLYRSEQLNFQIFRISGTIWNWLK